MSHYTQVKTELKDQEALVKALERIGFAQSAIEVGQDLKLKTYSGSSTNKHCQVRIKGAGWGSENNVGRLCNDIGFEKAEDGTYKMHVCDYAENNHKNFRTRVKQHYEAEVVKKFARQNHFYVQEEREENGELYLELNVPY